MNPVVQTTGRSFKGAAAYYLHDKRQEGEAARTTTERAAWVETVNLPTADPDRAWRMMAHTAISAPELKKAAGLKASKRTTRPVFTYALTWHPDEKPTREHQLECARETLDRLGMGHCQALIVSHNDTPHAHVHIIVNRVNPENGVAADDGNSAKILSKWALEYQRRHGQTYSPKREENAAKRAAGEQVDGSRKPRHQFEADRTTGNDSLSADFIRAEQRAKYAQLEQRDRDMKAAHAHAWADAKKLYETGKAKLADFRDQTTTRAIVAAGLKHAAQWEAQKQAHREERHAFYRREGTLLGNIWNAFQTVRELRRQEEDKGARTAVGIDAMTLLYVALSGRERKNGLDLAQQRERRELGQAQRAEIRHIRHTHGQTHDASLSKLRERYLAFCADLKGQQAAERAAQKHARKERGAEYRAAMAPIKARAEKWRKQEGGYKRHPAQWQGPARRMERTRVPEPPLPPKPKP
ncbi:relaxase/mobilization nuclease domain-containing protein [Methylocella sp.]|uniref:relaxase/mobilization nuclease domain-containing protein n=1 Tax=Methylocella sp. TaxID=1978226 RepID=UPI0035B30DA2